MQKIKQFLIKLHQWALSHPQYVRPLHTAWQSFLGVFLVGISPILHDVTQHHFNDAKVALIALLGAAVAAGLSTAKSQLWPIVVNWASSQDTHIVPPTDFIAPRS